jgi:formamidopyrimidine-DNA glycosylase
MPELPEVETTRRGVEPYSRNKTIRALEVREARLRWPVPASLPSILAGQRITAVERRAKYLLFRTSPGTLLVHLGMSGSLRLLKSGVPHKKHDHIDLHLQGGHCLRFNDPRRFGSFMWQESGDLHPLLASLGPEPLSQELDGKWLFCKSRGRKCAIKGFIMDGKVVVGVGNIYANEALYQAGIRPDRAAGRISLVRYERLAGEIKRVLTSAIEQGGTTLKDFVGGDGKPGYFARELNVYGREGLPCRACGSLLKEQRLGQRATVFCVACQR